MRRTILALVLAFAGFAGIAPAAHANAGFITCESTGYKYNYCGVRTQGRVIMMREISTGNLCRQGRGWGYDDNGIWVDRGCRAEFSYGRDDGGGGAWGRAGEMRCESIGYRYRYCNDGGIWVDRGCRGEFRYGRDSGGRNDAAIAAGIIGALAIGAAIGSAQSAPPPAPPPPLPPPAPKPTALPPAWAIGSYQAYDPDSGDIVQLVVDGGARVYLRNEVGAVVSQGSLSDGMIYWNNGKRSWFAREGPGVMVGDIDTGRHYYFRRNA
jgi:hypothetical protein